MCTSSVMRMRYFCMLCVICVSMYALKSRVSCVFSQAIYYCFPDACLCDYSYISCSRLAGYERGTFLVPNPEAVTRMHFFNLVLYFLNFIYDFQNLEFLVLLEGSVNCSALRLIAKARPDITIDALQLVRVS